MRHARLRHCTRLDRARFRCPIASAHQLPLPPPRRHSHSTWGRQGHNRVAHVLSRPELVDESLPLDSMIPPSPRSSSAARNFSRAVGSFRIHESRRVDLHTVHVDETGADGCEQGVCAGARFVARRHAGEVRPVLCQFAGSVAGESACREDHRPRSIVVASAAAPVAWNSTPSTTMAAPSLACASSSLVTSQPGFSSNRSSSFSLSQ